MSEPESMSKVRAVVYFVISPAEGPEYRTYVDEDEQAMGGIHAIEPGCNASHGSQRQTYALDRTYRAEPFVSQLPRSKNLKTIDRSSRQLSPGRGDLDMDVMHGGEPNESSPTTLYFIYLVEEDETGFCYIHFYSPSDVREHGGLVEFEADLFAKYLWFERLGTILVEQLPEGCHHFSDHELQRLVLTCNRRMVRTTNCSEFEYLPLDSQNSLRN